jgi:hypothetical protein
MLNVTVSVIYYYRCQCCLPFHLNAHYCSAALQASGNHHFFAAAASISSANPSPTHPPGTSKLMADVTSDDVVTLADPDTGGFITAPILSVTQELEHGVYNIYLTKAGMPIVNGVVMYPTADESLALEGKSRGWEAKHWGRHYSMAPMWQALEAGGALHLKIKSRTRF